MKETRRVYICPVCHTVYSRSRLHHGRRTQACEIGLAGDDRSKPLYDGRGQLLTRAPRWWVEACRTRQARTRKAKTGRENGRPE